MKPQEGMVCPYAPLSRGPDGVEFWLQGTMLKVAPVSTKYLSFVSLSIRKMSLALAGKCIAVAVACAGLAAEPKMVQRQTSFPTKHRVEHTCEPYWHSNCEICTRHCQGSEINGNLGGRGGGATFGAGVTAPFVASPPAVGSRAPTSLSRGSRDRRVVATSSILQDVCGLHHGPAVVWLPAPTVSRIEGGKRTRNMAKKRSLSGETGGGRCCFSFPMRMLGLRPCISMGRRSSSKWDCHLFFQTARAKCFSNGQRVHQSRCRHPTCRECSEGLTWVGWLEHWYT
jgi:hypothetical protein